MKKKIIIFIACMIFCTLIAALAEKSFDFYSWPLDKWRMYIVGGVYISIMGSIFISQE